MATYRQKQSKLNLNSFLLNLTFLTVMDNQRKLMPTCHCLFLSVRCQFYKTPPCRPLTIVDSIGNAKMHQINDISKIASLW